MLRSSVITALVLAGLVICAVVNGGVVTNAVGLTGGLRWDAAPRILAGNERSLDGGIRYSVSGGSYLALRDSFNWVSVPTEAQFKAVVEQSFAAWTGADPVSGTSSSLLFVSDFSTPIVAGGFGSIDFNGAEIDLVASDAGDAGLRGFTALQPVPTEVTLTSGVANYANSQAIGGVDLHLNNNAGAVYTLDIFQRLLTHEIGHAIGIGDVDLGGEFIDDDFDSADPEGTLTNSWIHLVDPLDPANSAGLSVYSVDPSYFMTSGVDLLMESNGLGIGPTNPLGTPVPLTNDEYGIRQFIYPSLTTVPEPSSSGLLVLVFVAGALRRNRRLATDA